MLSPEEGDFPENLHHVVYVIINQHSFEFFMCLDTITSSGSFERGILRSLKENQTEEAPTHP